MDKMSIPYERFVHCPDQKLLYNFNKYVCKINVTITIKLIVISVVVFDKINSFAASSSSASSIYIYMGQTRKLHHSYIIKML